MRLVEEVGLAVVIVVAKVVVGDAIWTTMTTLVPCELSVYVADAIMGMGRVFMFVVRDEDIGADLTVMDGVATLPEVEFVEDSFVMAVARLEVWAAAWVDIIVSVSRVVPVIKG